jgi:hypothetical protein
MTLDPSLLILKVLPRFGVARFRMFGSIFDCLRQIFMGVEKEDGNQFIIIKGPSVSNQPTPAISSRHPEFWLDGKGSVPRFQGFDHSPGGVKLITEIR